MNAFNTVLRNLGVFLLVCLLALAAFGSILSMLWALPGAKAVAAKLALTLLSAGLAFLVGGMLSARLNPAAPVPQALAFGLLLGGFGFVYLLGFTWGALFAAGLATLLAAAGGWLTAGQGQVR